MSEYNSEYLVKGYIGCDGLMFQPDRAGIVTDVYTRYPEFKRIVDEYCEKQAFQKKLKPSVSKVKDEKKWIQKALDKYLKFHKRKLNTENLPLYAVKQQSDLQATRIRDTKEDKREEQKSSWSKSQVSYKIQTGKPAGDIIKLAEDMNVDLIVMR